MAISREQFVECLGKCGLMSPTEVASLQALLPSDQVHSDGSAIASELVKQKKLTSYQASVLTQGKTGGLVFGDYKVLDKLGEGGMGMVFKAQHRYLKRIVALKVLHPAVTQSEEAIRRFHREVEAVARLSHPNIITAYDASVQENTYYLAMEFVDGIDLGRLVKEQGPLPVDKAIDYLIQAARGLEYSHKMGVVHRDIKPSNLLLDHEGRVRILDMGLVRFTDTVASSGSATGPEGLTQTGDIMGSFDYIAPEQAIDTKRADARADIYSLGCTLYYLLTGRPPYSGDTSMQKLLAHRETAIPSLRKARPEVPLSLEAIFSRMVAKKAEDRYASMSEVLADLEACRQPDSPRRLQPASAPARRPFGDGISSPSSGLSVLVCGTVCLLAVLAGNVFLAHEAMSHSWIIPDEIILIKQLALYTAITLTAIGTSMLVLGALVSRWLRLVRRTSTVENRENRLWSGLAGMVIGTISGAAIGSALVRCAEQERLVGSVLVGIFVGLALARRRSWLIVLGGALVGYLVGRQGFREVSLEALGLPLSWSMETAAAIGCAVIGAVVGTVLAVERRSPSTVSPLPPTTIRPPTPAQQATIEVDDKTVRRPHGPR